MKIPKSTNALTYKLIKMSGKEPAEIEPAKPKLQKYTIPKKIR